MSDVSRARAAQPLRSTSRAAGERSRRHATESSNRVLSVAAACSLAPLEMIPCKTTVFGRASHWSRNQVSNIPEIIPGASPRGPKQSIGVPGCAKGSLFCERERPPFSPPSSRASPHCERRAFTREASCSRWSALRGSELRQKVSWFPRNDVRRRTDFSDTRYEHCTASFKTARRFRRQAMPLQTEIGKIHTPPGTLPWEPRYLLRPFKPTGEAAGDSQ